MTGRTGVSREREVLKEGVSWGVAVLKAVVGWEDV